MSEEMKEVGIAIERIGWRHFTEGKLAIEMRRFQHDYLRQSRSKIRIDSWMRGLIDNLLIMLHEQWLCRNLCKHHRSRGTKALEARAELQAEIERQLKLGSDDQPEHSKCLLDVCAEHLYALPTDQQQYWVNAAEAARNEAFLTQTQLPEPNSSPATKLAPLFKKQAAKKPTEATDIRQNDQLLGPPPRRPRGRNGPVDRLDIRHRCRRQDIADSTIDLIVRQGSSNSVYNLKYTGADEVEHSQLRTLQPGTWLKDRVINCFLKHVLQPKVNSKRIATHTSFLDCSQMEPSAETLPTTITQMYEVGQTEHSGMEDCEPF